MLQEGAEPPTEAISGSIPQYQATLWYRGSSKIGRGVMHSEPVVFQAQLFRAAIGEQVSEQLGGVFRRLCSLTKELPQPVGESKKEMRERVRDEKHRILDLMNESSNQFIVKMRTRINNQAVEES